MCKKSCSPLNKDKQTDSLASECRHLVLDPLLYSTFLWCTSITRYKNRVYYLVRRQNDQTFKFRYSQAGTYINISTMAVA